MSSRSAYAWTNAGTLVRWIAKNTYARKRARRRMQKLSRRKNRL